MCWAVDFALGPTQEIVIAGAKGDQFIDKLRRLADALEAGEQFEIQIDNERIYVPVRATYNIEHERDEGEEEIEFQIKWSKV